MKPEELKSEKGLLDTETGEELDIIENEPQVDWVADNHKEFGCELIFITDKSPEGSQFVKGFSGIGGFLRYKVDYDQIVEANSIDEDDEDFI